ncbi:MAG TPA: recombinase family protein, partial [Solirubrobacterales bacterium]|nr:recombinase family protein [Solirubrobacterales bacterium]
MSTALIYVRQSRHRDYERTVSPEVQEQACRALPAVRQCASVEIFRDLDKSGKTIAQRPEFVRFLARVAAEPPAVIAVYDQSRTFRNTSEALDFYALMERIAEIEVAFHMGHFERSPAGEFTWTTMAAAHTMERRMTGAKIKDAKGYAIARGEMVGAVPAGYRWEGEGRWRSLVIDEGVAPLIRRVFAEYATGMYSTRDIAHRLNAERACLPRFKGGWRADTVAQLLGNVAYIGRTWSGGRTKRRGELIGANWPSLIDEGTWQRTQDLLNRYVRAGGRKGVGNDRQYAFQGLLRCARCGRRMHAHTIKERAYYNCRSNDQVEPCRKGVREDALLLWAERLLAVLDSYRPVAVETAVAARLAKGKPQPAQDAIAQIDLTVERLGKRFEWGHLDEDSYRAEWERLQGRRRELVAAGSKPFQDSPFALGSLMSAWDTGSPQTRRELLAAFFQDIDVLDNQVEAVRPREDRAAEVAALLDRAFDSFVGVAPAGFEPAISALRGLRPG